MIEARDIHKSYGKLHVLKGVDLKVGKGEIVSIVGKSGTGKSTLLHILGTLDRADQGQLLIDDQDITAAKGRKLSAFRNRRIGFIFQFHHLLPEFDAVDNVCMPAFIAGTPADEARSRAKELLEYLELGERLDHKPGELSGGEQQRVAVARALMNNPGIVFADEPSGNLDTTSSQSLHELILQLRKDFEQTFVIVTHNRDLAAMSDRRLEMIDGRLVTP